MGWGQPHVPAAFTPRNTRYLLYKKLGGPQGRYGRVENLVPTGIRSRTVQPAAQSLHRLSYPAHPKHVENRNKHARKICASCWLFTKIIQGCTVNKAWKKIGWLLITKTIRSMHFDYVLIIGRKLNHKYHLRALTAKKKIWIVNFWANLIRKKNCLLG